MNDNYDFPVEWHKSAISRMRSELNKMDKCLSALKNTETRYYQAHVIVRDMYRVALDAMLSIPAPKPREQP